MIRGFKLDNSRGARTNTRQVGAISVLEQPSFGVPEELTALCMHVSDVVQGSVAKVFPERPSFAFSLKNLLGHARYTRRERNAIIKQIMKHTLLTR